ncbi:hypothetical protein AXK11_02045 [Cephaloticoccus primus]|uniref:Uncharacterized protein n=1 Tax=Cephaloticoccus primus TaxID=1548207 RepID=A0A139SSQ0_9BACT|nr:hypothetical protein [Cephaloticoccus primus]KXU37599.1 hypothetical protein AXK11_02045 [Cephaloticoccus primus]
MKVKEGGDLAVYFVDGQFVLQQLDSGAGSLDVSNRGQAAHGLSAEEAIGQYLGALDEQTKKSA